MLYRRPVPVVPIIFVVPVAALISEEVAELSATACRINAPAVTVVKAGDVYVFPAVDGT
jgi:hypothetical protein